MNNLAVRRIERESVTEKVVAVLRNSILSGDLQPGTRLIESQLAERLGVSRAPLREAFGILEPEGLVFSQPGGGTFVAEITSDDLHEVYTLRSVLEGLAMRLAFERVTKGELAELSTIVDQMLDAAQSSDAERFTELDLGLHERIWRLSRHSRLYGMLANMLGPIRMSLALNTRVYDDLVEDAHEHVRLLQALSEGDKDQAERVMVEHIEEAGNRNIKYLRRGEVLPGQAED